MSWFYFMYCCKIELDGKKNEEGKYQGCSETIDTALYIFICK